MEIEQLAEETSRGARSRRGRPGYRPRPREGARDREAGLLPRRAARQGRTRSRRSSTTSTPARTRRSSRSTRSSRRLRATSSRSTARSRSTRTPTSASPRATTPSSTRRPRTPSRRRPRPSTSTTSSSTARSASSATAQDSSCRRSTSSPTQASSYGGVKPANFLDIGGGASAEVMANGLNVILGDDEVKSVFVNVFGGITACDAVANGIVQALEMLGDSGDQAACRAPRRQQCRRGTRNPQRGEPPAGHRSRNHGRSRSQGCRAGCVRED